jgi:hypothetical protein
MQCDVTSIATLWDSPQPALAREEQSRSRCRVWRQNSKRCRKGSRMDTPGVREMVEDSPTVRRRKDALAHAGVTEDPLRETCTARGGQIGRVQCAG